MGFAEWLMNVKSVGFFAMVLLLLYAVIINTEHQMGSQRYYVTAAINPEPASIQPSNKSGPTEAKSLQCVGKNEAIDFEIKFERMAGLQNVEREKMHVFSKWINCGIL